MAGRGQGRALRFVALRFVAAQVAVVVLGLAVLAGLAGAAPTVSASAAGASVRPVARSAAVATSGGYAPIDQPGPALQVPKADLDASLRCPADLAGVTRDVVLMIPGTTVDPDEAFAWNYEKALAAEHMPYCTVTVPNHTDGDIQVAAEYVVSAVRTIRAATGRKVILFGWSQGASTLPRWALRWWPDIRPMVASLVGLAPLNNKGSAVATGLCLPGSCIPAGWQQAIGSKFMAALNSRSQTFPNIAYTAIYTRVDDVVTPDVDGSLSVLPPGPNVTNVAIQDVCPTDLSDHLLIPASPTAYAIALDAFRHPGEPADLGRVRVHQPCLPGTMPHVSPLDVLTQEVRIAGNVGPRVLEGRVSAEPPLACYVTASC